MGGGGAMAQPPLPGYVTGVIKTSAQLTKGGPCHNFAYYYMLIILSWRPKGGWAMAQCPPLNTPLLISIVLPHLFCCVFAHMLQIVLENFMNLFFLTDTANFLSGPSSLPVVVAQLEERLANKARRSVLHWFA